MKRNVIFGLFLLTLLGVMIGGSAYYTYASYATATVDLETSPAVIFSETCMTPGDVITKKVTVYNRGTLDYDYDVSCEMVNGDLLFSVLQIEIKNSAGTTLYTGPLGGLKNQYIGTLAAGYEEVLDFTISFPKEADNRYALSNTDVNFNFVAIEHQPVLPPGGGKVLFEHPIINNQFVLLKGSSIPIKFHILTATGEHEQNPREGITLEVVGPNAEGIRTVYTFSFDDPVDVLKWDDNLDDAHYVAVFSTKVHPVMVGGEYRAQVKDNGTVIGYIDFTVDESSNANRSNSLNEK